MKSHKAEALTQFPQYVATRVPPPSSGWDASPSQVTPILVGFPNVRWHPLLIYWFERDDNYIDQN